MILAHSSAGGAKNRFLFGFLLLFILVFPKAGIKVGILPLTVGYTFLALTAICSLFRSGFFVTHSRLLVLFFLLPLQCCIAIPVLIYGISNLSFFFSLLTGFFFLPWIFLGVFSKFMETFDLSFFLRFFRKGMLFIAAYGIFLFCYRILTGKLLLIPFLAANLSDANDLELTKCIIRGDWLKLISTYQNGIIYGVSLLILLPLYNVVETSRWKRGIVKLSLILTLTRTVWIGLAVAHIIEYFFQKKMTPRRLFSFCIQGLVGIGMLFWILSRLNFDVGFLFDSALGGRIEQVRQAANFTFFGSQPIGELGEILYMGALNFFGIAGLLSLLAGLSIPLWLYFLRKGPKDSIKKALAFGLLIYLIIASSDGAVQYIPVMAFYWFTSSLLLSERELQVLP